MRTLDLVRVAVVFAAITLAVVPPPALAQTGPLVLEQVDDDVMAAPDYKITGFNGDTGQLAGGYVGKVFDDKLLIGAAAYWLVHGNDADRLGYGGLLVGWSAAPISRLRFGARALTGIGSATVGLQQTFPVGGRHLALPDRIRFGDVSTARTVRYRDDFLLFEPQGTITASVTSRIGVNLGGGYRFAGMTDGLGDRIRGPIGTIGLELAW